MPSWQWSPVVQLMPSSHAAVEFVCTHAPAAHPSIVQALPSLHHIAEPTQPLAVQ